MAIVRSQAVLGPLKSLLQCGSLSALTDGQLLERFQNGRGAMAEAAFEALIDRHGAMVLGVCRRILVDPHDADDAFQATFLILVQRAHKVCVDDSLGRWLHGVSYRVALRAKSQATRRKRLEERAAAHSDASHSNDLGTLDLRSVLDEELGRLPEKYRAPVILCHLQGLSQNETARVLGWPLGTVQGRLARARETLRDRLARRGMAPSAAFSINGLFAQGSSGTVPTTLRHRTVQVVMRRLVGEATWAGAGSASAIALAEGVAGTLITSKLKFASILVLLGAIGASTTVLPQQATAELRTSVGETELDLAAPPTQVPVEPRPQPPTGPFRIPLRAVPAVDSENAIELRPQPPAETFRFPLRAVPAVDSENAIDVPGLVLISLGAQQIVIPESNSFIRVIHTAYLRATQLPWIRPHTGEHQAHVKVVQQVDKESVPKGRQVQVRILVENLSKGVVKNAVVRAKFSPGLRPTEGATSDNAHYELALGDLSPGQRVHLDPLVLTATETGEQSCEVKVTSLDDAPGAEEAKSVRILTVTEPKLTVTWDGPEQAVTRSLATYVLTVENSGALPVQNVRIQATLPVQSTLVKLPQNAKFDHESRQLTWDGVKLDPGKTQRSFMIRMGKPGRFKVVAQTDGEPGLHASETIATEVIGKADLELEITEYRHAVDLDKLTTFNVTIRNKGSKEARDIRIVGQHSDNIAVEKTAGTEEPARYQSAPDRKFVFPTIPRLKSGKELIIGIQVRALKPGLATCRVSLSHAGDQPPLEDAAAFKIPPGLNPDAKVSRIRSLRRK